MRQIVKLPLESPLQNMLEEKQAKINQGAKPPKKWLRSKFKNQIKDKLLLSQKYLCCYCEDRIEVNDCHIEHFYEQSHREGKKLVYNYEDNLIASCEKNTCCGHYKGGANHNRVSVDYESLLNPTNDNSKLLTYTNVGKIEASTKIESEIKKVHYTIQRLNLNGQILRNDRFNKIKQINQQMIDEKMNLAEQKQFIVSLLNENKAQLPSYFSTIKDNFSFLIAN